MQPEDQSFRSFTYEKEVERAKWFKEDLDKGAGWCEVYKGPGSTYWIKTFPEEEVPIKVLMKFNIPIPAKTFVEMLFPTNQEARNKWDEGFKDHKTLEAYSDNGEYVTYMRLLTSWPLADRDFVLFIPPIKEVDWDGKQSFLFIQKNAWHPSKPENEGGIVRATNGGNFFILTPDEQEPGEASKMFALSNNNYNVGCLPNSNVFIKKLLSKAIPQGFDKLREDMIKGYKEYFQNGQD